MPLADYIQANLGKIMTAPGGVGGQCVDWVNLCLQQVWRAPLVRANAVDWQHVTIRGFRWTPNTPTNYPEAGGLVVWGESGLVATGPNGHIAVAILASPRRFLSADQNWPDGAPVSLVWHNYDGVLGWQVPI